MKYCLIILTACISGTAFAESKNTKTNSPNGRYQLIQLSEFRRDQYLLDTQTGRIWVRGCEIPGKEPSECVYAIWGEQDVIGLNTTIPKVKALKEALLKEQ